MSSGDFDPTVARSTTSPRSRRSTATTCCTASPRSRRCRPRSRRWRAGAARFWRAACPIWSPSAPSERDVVGYCYAGLIRPRSAYRFTVEDSIYIDGAEVGRGIGRALLSELIERCTELGYRQMVAVIGGSETMAVDPAARGARLYARRCVARGRLQIRRAGSIPC